MKILIIGSGIAGMSAAIQAVELGAEVDLLSPYPSERAQSVMAAGGINAVLDESIEGDSVESHVDDTYKGGCFIESKETLGRLCGRAPEHIRWIERMGVVFSRNADNTIAQRAFGGQSHRRTAYAGASTGKQIVSALVQKCREYEIAGKINRVLGLNFHSALIREGRVFGAVMMNSVSGDIEEYYADAVIMATGGQNKLFGKTTGTEICDGYAAGRLFSQGVRMRNLEFVQYHPTSIETSHKRMLITEAARGEGGRLYYMKDGERCYFMEDLFGEKGNLMPRDIVAKCIYDCPSQVYLDIAFLGKRLIHERLQEVYDLCMDYIDLDVTRESIPVYPSVHFFMGGIAVDDDHETNISRLFAVGECASKYHGANRLGGNSLLAAVHSGRTAAEAAWGKYAGETAEAAFDDYMAEVEKELARQKVSKSRYPSVYVMKEIAEIMNRNLGITRGEAGLKSGIEQIDFYLDVIPSLKFDSDVSIYENCRLYYLALLAKAVLMSAEARKESRGSHIRDDYPEKSEAFEKHSFAVYKDGKIEISFSN